MPFKSIEDRTPPNTNIKSNKQSENYLLLCSHLSDAGKYSYCTICVIAMNELFNNEWDKAFCEHGIDMIIFHLQLPKSVKPAMKLLLTGEFSQSYEPCLGILKEEEVIANDCSILLYDFILLAVKDGTYDARWRVLAQNLAEKLDISQDTVEEYEICVIDCLVNCSNEKTELEKEERRSNQQTTRFKRYAMIGLASLGGGALIGVTGGLAAPFIGAGIASLGLGSLVGGGAALLGTAAGVAIVGSLFGAAGAGLTGYKMHKRVGDIEEFAFDRLDLDEPDNNNQAVVPADATRFRQLHISILISGWLKDESTDNYTRPWLCVRASQEQYFLRYESRYLLAFGRAIEYMLSMAFSIATQEVLKYTALSGLLSAIAWPGALLGLANIIDNPWSVCCRRSAQVGKQLAEVLLTREQGQRPVTLVGFSIGARVIYYCLREMAERGKCEGIIQDAVLIGAPCSGNPVYWQKFTKVVAGRIINGYCKTDWLLKFLYRTLSMPSHGVAGLHPIELSDRRMCNIDLSDIVSGHTDYSDKMCLILRTMKIKVKEGPCGEVKMPRAQTLDDIPREKSENPHPPLRRTRSLTTIPRIQEQSSSTEEDIIS